MLDRPEILSLYLALDSAATRSRFGFRPGKNSIENYVSNIDLSQICFGAFKQDGLIGLCETKPIDDRTSIIAIEMAFVIGNAYRKTGIGYLLGQAVSAEITAPAFVMCSTLNPAMAQLALKLGLAPLSPSRLIGLPEYLRIYAEDSISFLASDAEEFFSLKITSLNPRLNN